MTPKSCKNCASVEFTAKGFHLQCDYCKTFYDFDLSTENRIINALECMGYSVKWNGSEYEVYNPKYPDYKWWAVPPFDIVEYENILKSTIET